MNAAGAAVASRRAAETTAERSHRGREASVASGTVLAAVASSAVCGRAVAAPLAAAGVLALIAAVCDSRTGRIPNSIPVAVVAWVLVGAGLVVTVDHRSSTEVAGSVLAGWLLSSAPFLALVWLLRSSAVGGGDVKLLSGLGCIIGLLAPYAACVLLLVAVIIALATAIVARARRVVLGPGLAAGYAVAVAAGVAANEMLGGRYL